MKLYFQKDEEMAYSLQYHLDYMKENDIKEMEVFEAKIEYVKGFFFCKEFGSMGEVGEGCGKICIEYSPRNGKSGRCKHSGHLYSPGKSKILKIE